MAGVELGRVVGFEQGLPWRVVFPDLEHVAASAFLRELAASDCSAATICGGVRQHPIRSLARPHDSGR